MVPAHLNHVGSGATTEREDRGARPLPVLGFSALRCPPQIFIIVSLNVCFAGVVQRDNRACTWSLAHHGPAPLPQAMGLAANSSAVWCPKPHLALPSPSLP